MRHHRIIRVAALTLALTGLAAPAAGARSDIGPPPVVHQDQSGFYRPVAQQTHKGIAAPAAAAPACGKDYSRNSVDGNYCPPRAATAIAPKAVDLRSPDARDAARGGFAHTTPAVAATSKPGTDWGEIGIIGGSALAGLVLVGLGFALFTRRTPVLSR